MVGLPKSWSCPPNVDLANVTNNDDLRDTANIKKNGVRWDGGAISEDGSLKDRHESVCSPGDLPLHDPCTKILNSC
ncbi:MAG: hypothetical protein H6Q85_1228 [candidate division NC10 bacterium]|nr:hypothetical protein [candidate division NC10 bacterium]